MKKIILLVLFATEGLSYAQVSSTITIEFSNPAVMSMEIDRSILSVQLKSNFSAGPIVLSNPVLVTIKSNVPWSLTAIANTDFLSTDNIANSISCGQLEYKSRISGSTENVQDQQEEYLAFVKNQNMTLASGGATPNDGLRIMVEYRLMVNLKDPAGNYSLPIVLTLNPSQ